MRAGVDDDGAVRDAERPRLRFVEAGAGGGEVERLEDGGADRAVVGLAGGGVAGEHVVGRDARLAVGRPRERDQRRLARDAMDDLDRVADGEDVGIGSGEMRVDLDPARWPEFEPRLARELCFRADADRHDDDVSVDALAARQEHDDMVGPVLEMLDLVAEVELDRLVAEVRMDDRRHLLVEWREDVRRALDHGGEEAALVEILRDLEADVAAADHHGPPRVRLAERGHDSVEIGNGVQGENSSGIDAGDLAWPHGRCAWRQEQAIVGLVCLFAGVEVAQTHGFRHAVDRQRLGAGADVDAIARLEQGFLGDEKLRSLGDGAGDVIGQPAVGEADVGSALDEHDLRGFADAAQARGRGGAARDAADDDDLHVVGLFGWRSLRSRHQPLILECSYASERAINGRTPGASAGSARRLPRDHRLSRAARRS